MTRPSKSSTPQTSTRTKRSTGGLIPRKVIKRYLNQNGKKNAITKTGFNTLQSIVEKLLEKMIMKVKCEINEVLPKNKTKTSISSNHVIHAANSLSIPSEIVEDAIEMTNTGRTSGVSGYFIIISLSPHFFLTSF